MCSQLTERRQGNQAYKQRDFAKALHHYERAQAVVEFVQGLTRVDQAEVDINRVVTNLNLAALSLATQEFGRAVEYCDKALELEPQNVKALARRCKAHTGGHEYAEAARDLERLRLVNPGSSELSELEAALAQMQQSNRLKERETYAHMLGRSKSALNTSQPSARRSVAGH